MLIWLGSLASYPDALVLYVYAWQTVAALTATVSAALGVPAARIFMNLDDVLRTNFARDGALIPERK